MTFQTDICSKEAWQCEVADGASGALQVVELYADWAGPCKAVKELFRKLYFDHGDGGATGVPLKFYTVNVDRVPALEQHKGRCQPLFMMYKDGRLLDKVEGVEGPKLTHLVTSLLRK
ncbi:Dynein light chain, flagellar outer arm [Monoraphidium neglectum]|uniref:Dynein light chain, flagellar outer arm n=1 Tax=Monoraphidium neglectum TaxID=145388 RepID=A0A0D2MJ60_9CHLO|nr:Dynein light chain, flagellar outer arm [Monoraphidium neglectum]KIZ03050.1 Dynein light chain, flagellar outer arm [Monoraphidium neglectum]|eukprot:XP_013902069.1 Dynein light chain, flagellar outer arm [Monoraphidium neglectum]